MHSTRTALARSCSQYCSCSWVSLQRVSGSVTACENTSRDGGGGEFSFCEIEERPQTGGLFHSLSQSGCQPKAGPRVPQSARCVVIRYCHFFPFILGNIGNLADDAFIETWRRKKRKKSSRRFAPNAGAGCRVIRPCRKSSRGHGSTSSGAITAARPPSPRKKNNKAASNRSH